MHDDWTTHVPYVRCMADLVVVPTECADSTACEDTLARSGLKGERPRWWQRPGVEAESTSLAVPPHDTEPPPFARREPG